MALERPPPISPDASPSSPARHRESAARSPRRLPTSVPTSRSATATLDGLASAAAAIEAMGRRVSTAELDVRDADGVQAWADGIARDLGPVDVLVNNAGGGFVSPFLDLRPKGITALVDENFSSVVHCIRAFVPSMRDGGSIINITSIEAFRAAPNYSVYAAMKAAVEQLTRTLALELGDRAIRVNCIAPDAIVTPGVSALQASGDARGERRDRRHVRAARPRVAPTTARAPRCSSRRPCRDSSPAAPCTSTAARSPRPGGVAMPTARGTSEPILHRRPSDGRRSLRTKCTLAVA